MSSQDVTEALEWTMPAEAQLVTQVQREHLTERLVILDALRP